MSQERNLNTVQNYTPNQEHYIVIGSGPAGMRFVQELYKRQPDAHITVFGNEPFQPYNRIQLSALLAGEISREAMDIPLPKPETHPNFRFVICAVQSIDKANKTLSDAQGRSYTYDHLILAVGARSHVPDIPGAKQTGVYTFRNLKDTESLYARVTRSRHVVVVGGGLLGLEAARGMLRFNTKVTIVQQAPRLMNRQLNEQAAQLLQHKVEALGIEVITHSGLREVIGEGRVEAIKLRSGQVLECDTVLLCAGITPNIELARNSKIQVSRGISVSDTLQTSDESIYAIGECCEHRGQTYGLAAPGFEQAAVLADTFCGGTARYTGSLLISRLKVVGQKVYSMGTVADLARRPLQREYQYLDKKTGTYRQLVVYRGAIVGAAGIGEWPELSRIQEAFQTGRKFNRFQLLYFSLSGRLWLSGNTADIKQWPATTLVCQCNSINIGQLKQAIEQGCKQLPQLQEATGAGTVCGSCKPLLSELIGSGEPKTKETAWPVLVTTSLMALAICTLIALWPESQVAQSVQQQGLFEKIWNDKFWKQVTGFSLLGLSVIGLVVSLRKRLKLSFLGNYDYLRVVHTVLGVLCAATLILHTGFHFGSNLNQILLMDFLAVISLGAIASAAVGLSHTLKPNAVKSVRKLWTWLHIIVTWPLPALLGIHILTVYYF